MAQDTLRLLGDSGVTAAGFVASRPNGARAAAQRLVRVSEAVVVRSADFRFVRTLQPLEVIAGAGAAIATDGAHGFRTPYADCVPVMPSTKHLNPAATAVRWGATRTSVSRPGPRPA